MKFKIMEMLTNDHFVTMDNCRGALNDHSTFIVQNPSVVYAYSIEYVQDRWLFINCDYDTKQYRDTVYDTIQECEVPFWRYALSSTCYALFAGDLVQIFWIGRFIVNRVAFDS